MGHGPFQSGAPGLRDLGISAIPLMARSKRPAIEAWSVFCNRMADDETFRRWLGWQHSNIGVCLGLASDLVAFDLDHDMDGLHDKIVSLLPETPCAKAGAKGKTLFYRFNGEQSQGFSKNGQRVLDVLSGGRQTVIPPSIHPDTNEPYRWLSGGLVKPDELPQVPRSTWFKIQLLFEKGPVYQPTAPRQLTKVYADADEQEIASALSCIPADDYETWVQIGMCLKAEFGDKGFDLWDNWSATDGKYVAGEMRGKFASFKGAGLTIATLFYRAFDYGFSHEVRRAPAEKIEDFVLNGKMTGWHPEVPKPEVVATVAPETPEPIDSATFPARLLNATGMVGRIADFINVTSITPQPILALAASIAATGTIMGHRVRTETDLRSNMYCLALAPSGSGKDHARKVVARLLHDSGMGERQLGIPKSSSGLVKVLRDQGKGIGLVIWDELGRVLQQLGHWKAGTHERDIITTVIEMFSSASSVYSGFAYANHDGKNPPAPIDQPCLSIYGTSVPGRFYEALSNNDAVDGFLGRWLIFETRDYALEEPGIRPLIEVSKDMLDEMQLWKNMATNANPAGNADMAIKPRIAHCTATARTLLDAYSRDRRREAMMCEKNGEPYAPIWSRAGEHARKLSVLISDTYTIEEDDARWAIDVAHHCCSYMVAAIAGYVSSNELEAQTKKIRRFIGDNTKTGTG